MFETLKKWITAMVVAISLIASPFSMSHAQISAEHSHTHQIEDTKSPLNGAHSIDYVLVDFEKSGHDHHDEVGCCIGYCGGALNVDFQEMSVPATRSVKYLFCDQSPASNITFDLIKPPSI